MSHPSNPSLVCFVSFLLIFFNLMAQEENRSGKKEKKQRTIYTGFSFKLSFRMCMDGEGAERAVIAGEVVGVKELSL